MHNLYGQFSHGGAETVVEMMTDELKAAGQEIFLITTKPHQSPTPVQTDLKIYYLNSAFHDLAKIPAAGRLFWHLGNIFSFKKYREIKKILAAEKPDLMITHNLMGLGFLTPLAIRRLKIKHEHWLHDIQLLHPSGLMIWGQEKKINSVSAKIYQMITRALFASPNKIISPSAWLLKMHESRGFFKNSEKGVRPLKFKSKFKSESISPKSDDRRFLFIGQIEEQKGIFLLINAFKRINDPDSRLTIVFRNEPGQLDKARKMAGDDKRIEFLGPLTFSETEKIMAGSDCLIVPSLCYENSPTTIYGAHAADLPVIASDIGGIPEIIGPDDCLFRPGDEEDLIEKILSFTKNPLE